MRATLKPKQKKGKQKMTKNEAINYIEKCSDTPCGFIVMAVSREDIEQCYSDEFLEKFDNLPVEAQNKVLGKIAEMATDLLEDYDYGDTICTISDKVSGLV